MANTFAPEYVDVATRLVEFRDKHPEGALQPADLSTPFQIVTIGSDTYIVVVAAAYRSPDDPRPGVGMAYEAYPGKTPYTRGSELQNAETSAWGRAIMAALAADSRRGIASADEVRNRQAERTQHRGSGRDWIAEAEATTTLDALRVLYDECKVAGEGNADIEAAMKVRAGALQTDADPWAAPAPDDAEAAAEGQDALPLDAA